ncbi:MAG: FAD-binding oxidoreductase [Gammaproteobacteria bacterium]
MRYILALVLCSFLSIPVAAELRPFTSDGCSAFPDGPPDQGELWLSCCINHDRSYWLGGTYDERQAADIALKDCVAALGKPDIASLMLSGVRVGGTPWLPTTFRWGYGWPWPRGYRALSKKEKAFAFSLPKMGAPTIKP